MAVTPSILANGQLPSTVGALFTASGVTYITKIIITNGGSSAETVNLYIKKSGGSDRLVGPKNLSLAVGDSWTIDFRGGLASGDAIDGVTTTASTVDYIIMGGTA